MFLEFWDVGMVAPGVLPLTPGEMSSHLSADWVPSLPPVVGSSFVGWPLYSVERVNLGGHDMLALRKEAGRSERQWKSVLSWMAGVAGTRHVLAAEGYRWIAPLSAFYPEAVQAVDLSAWHPSFPRTSVAATRRPGSPSRFRPDYLALRSTSAARGGAPYEWAVVESKGTKEGLARMTSFPRLWFDQARNTVVTLHGSEIAIDQLSLHSGAALSGAWRWSSAGVTGMASDRPGVLRLPS